MNNFIENNLYESFIFTNKQVDNIKCIDTNFNKSHTAKMLDAQIDIYKIIIYKLLANETK